MLPQLKFMYSEKATKFDEISKVYLKSLSNVIFLDNLSYFCDLLWSMQLENDSKCKLRYIYITLV